MKLKRAMKEAAKEVVNDIKNYQVCLHLSKQSREDLTNFGLGVWVTLPFLIGTGIGVWYLISHFKAGDLSNVYTSLGILIGSAIAVIPWASYWFKVYDKISI